LWLWFVFFCIMIFFFLHFEMWINSHTLKFSVCSWKASIFFWLCAMIYELMYLFNISFGACFEHFIRCFCCAHVHLQCLFYKLPILNITFCLVEQGLQPSNQPYLLLIVIQFPPNYY
jgi:hypothetical protein